MQKGIVMPFKPKTEVSDHRCSCGSLIAKITLQGIEIKCRKCKQIQVIPFPGGDRQQGSWSKGE